MNFPFWKRLFGGTVPLFKMPIGETVGTFPVMDFYPLLSRPPPKNPCNDNVRIGGEPIQGLGASDKWTILPVFG